ncbi:MAG: preprotein translocase subunit SecE [Atopostipes suicloacalis]|nr:preprotein translocase subunit SecE [Atopostipes suicloacalis]
MDKVTNFIKDVKHEMNETTWPTAKEMRKNTVSVFTIVFLFAVFFFAVETVIVELLAFI